MEASTNIKNKKKNAFEDEDFYKAIKLDNDTLFKNLKSNLFKTLTRRSETINATKKTKVLKGIIINFNYFNRSVDIPRKMDINNLKTGTKKFNSKKVKKSKKLIFNEISDIPINSETKQKKKKTLTSIKTETANTTIPSENQENGTDRSNSIKNLKNLIKDSTTPNTDSKKRTLKEKKKGKKKSKNDELTNLVNNPNYISSFYNNCVLFPQVYLPYASNPMYQVLNTKPLNVEK